MFTIVRISFLEKLNISIKFYKHANWLHFSHFKTFFVWRESTNPKNNGISSEHLVQTFTGAIMHILITHQITSSYEHSMDELKMPIHFFNADNVWNQCYVRFDTFKSIIRSGQNPITPKASSMFLCVHNNFIFSVGFCGIWNYADTMVSPKRVTEWSSKDVAVWLEENQQGEHRHIFLEHMIDGKALLTLREEDLKSMNITRMGQVKRLFIVIRQLQKENLSSLFELGHVELFPSSTALYAQQKHDVRNRSFFASIECLFCTV